VYKIHSESLNKIKVRGYSVKLQGLELNLF
jgi:hypothetical protein